MDVATIGLAADPSGVVAGTDEAVRAMTKFEQRSLRAAERSAKNMRRLYGEFKRIEWWLSRLAGLFGLAFGVRAIVSWADAMVTGLTKSAEAARKYGLALTANEKAAVSFRETQRSIGAVMRENAEFILGPLMRAFNKFHEAAAQSAIPGMTSAQAAQFGGGGRGGAGGGGFAGNAREQQIEAARIAQEGDALLALFTAMDGTAAQFEGLNEETRKAREEFDSLAGFTADQIETWAGESLDLNAATRKAREEFDSLAGFTAAEIEKRAREDMALEDARIAAAQAYNRMAESVDAAANARRDIAGQKPAPGKGSFEDQFFQDMTAGGAAPGASDLSAISTETSAMVGQLISMKALMAGMISALVAFVATSETFKQFTEKLQVILRFLQTVLEPLKPVLDQIALMLLGVAKLGVMFIKPFIDLWARYILPQLQALTKVLSLLLGVFGIKINKGDLDLLEAIKNEPTVELRLDASEALQELNRARDALLAAGDPVAREAARQRFFSARAAAEAAQRAATTQNEPESIFGEEVEVSWLQNLANIGAFLKKIQNFLEKIWGFFNLFFRDALGALTAIWRGIWGTLFSLFNTLGSIWNMLSSIWYRISDVVGAIGKLMKKMTGAEVPNWDPRSWASGTNLTLGTGMALYHPNEAVLPSPFNPSSPGFDAMAFWQPALSALGGMGGGGMTVLIMDSGGGLSDGEPTPQQQAALKKGLSALERSGHMRRGTVLA